MEHYPSKGIFYLYELKCRGGVRYIGITKNWRKRIKQHIVGKGAKVTSVYRPTSIRALYRLGEMSYQKAEYIEDKYTLWVMKKYGKKVRGGHYCHLREDVSDILKSNVVASSIKNLGQKIPIPKEVQRLFAKKEKSSSGNKSKNSWYRDKKRMLLMSPEEAADFLYAHWQETNVARDWNKAWEKVLKKHLYLA